MCFGAYGVIISLHIITGILLWYRRIKTPRKFMKER